ncbi:hypothetical protein LR48_Vigan02g116200 [Vigna angularis]|uniref:Uncharacterized protein n=1 Tax=Phaseolus angularis TaxID=3914 RepID=A0A0L9TX97_PHAAN|nr:hypothetical protein LR48_Vigan02g116200 [Vigna angularis]
MTQEITKKVRAELYDEVAEMVARQFQQRYEDYGNRPPPSPVAEHVVPPTGRSGKGSCSAAGAPGDDMDETRPCEGVVKNVEVGEDVVKNVEKVKMGKEKRRWARSDFGCAAVLKKIANVERLGMG